MYKDGDQHGLTEQAHCRVTGLIQSSNPLGPHRSRSLHTRPGALQNKRHKLQQGQGSSVWFVSDTMGPDVGSKQRLLELPDTTFTWREQCTPFILGKADPHKVWTDSTMVF